MVAAGVAHLQEAFSIHGRNNCVWRHMIPTTLDIFPGGDFDRFTHEGRLQSERC